MMSFNVKKNVLLFIIESTSLPIPSTTTHSFMKHFSKASWLATHLIPLMENKNASSGKEQGPFPSPRLGV